ncbi:MAG TPA: LD-carboxypeptidase [Terriglobales bacterium]|nr:LD-carboxypeptidase [Terriglobales bacterium]
MVPERDILKPPPLRRGDKIGVVAPASNIQRDALDAGLKRLQELGYQVELGDSVFEQDLYFAGSPEARARDLMHMFQRADIRAIICARGGYGSNYLLPLLDLELIRRNPKIFVGYSDLTSLLTWINDEVGLVTFHGPMVAKDFAHVDGVDVDSWLATVEARNGVELNATPLCTGEGEGTLYGGCLSILVASLGTQYEIETGETILFMEDIGAKPYQIDRMLMQLKYAGKFEGVRGIVFGEMQDCFQPGGQNYTLEEVILRVLGDLKIPIAFGLPSGHVRSRNVTLPFGIRARLQADSSSATLRLLETAVSAHSHSASI